MANKEFQLDKVLFEKRATLYTNTQMGLVGAALMLMMMDLSKAYLLAPLIAIFILASWYKNHLNGLHDEFKNYHVEIAPKSVLLVKPQDQVQPEKRILFREIEEVTQHQENFIPVFTLYLKGNADKVSLPALQHGEEFVDMLNTLLQEPSSTTNKD